MYPKQHPWYCDIDLHARPLSVCLLDQAGATLLHRHRTATPEARLKARDPYRAQLVRAAACLLTGSWLADLCAAHGIPVGLGHARSMPAIHGGKANQDTIDAQTIAVLLRGGLLPPPAGYPAERRAPRDLRRRRMPLPRTRAALLAHGHHTPSPSPLPAIATTLASTTNRDGVAERGAAPAVPQSLAGARALLTDDAALWRDGALTSIHTAQPHDAHTLSRRPTVPGIGTRLRLVRLDDIHEVHRCPRGQACGSSGRRGPGVRASAGQRDGTAGTTIGTAHHQWACADAAVLCRSDHPAAPQSLARLEQKHAPGQARTIRAQQWARAVDHRRPRQVACERAMGVQRSGRGADAPGASLDTQGRHLPKALACA